MKVILSIDPVRFPLTGIGRYTFELARHLKGMPQIEQLRFFSGYRFADDLPESVQSAKPTAVSPSNFRQTILKNSLSIEMYRLVSPLLKRYALRGYSDHVYHGPNFYLPPFGGPSVCTFHDLSVFTWAHCHPPERIRYMRKEIALTLKRADMLITDSEYTRQEVASYFSWPLDKIRAVPLACSADFRPRASDELIPVLRKQGLNLHGYSLYVGTIEPRKNLEALLDAYVMLKWTPLSRQFFIEFKRVSIPLQRIGAVPFLLLTLNFINCYYCAAGILIFHSACFGGMWAKGELVWISSW